MDRNFVVRGLSWALKEAQEKVNIPATWKQLKKLGGKYGKRFLVFAVIWEIFEDVILPIISWVLGVPELIPILLIFHFEVVAYPVAFCAFKEWDRLRGVTTMYPEGRDSWSTLSRSLAKVSIYMMAASGWVFIYMGQGSVWAGSIFLSLLFTLGFVHERMWHDSNYGIRENNTVEFKRCVVKTGTFTGLGALTMFSALHVTGLPMNPSLFIVYHIVAAILYLGLEAVWSRSTLGVKTLEEENLKCQKPKK